MGKQGIDPRTAVIPAGRPAAGSAFTVAARPPPYVEADRIGRTFRRGRTSVAALLSVSCRVLAGDRIALIGPSGSGKSTLLHLLAGLETPTSGGISWPGLGQREALRPGQVAIVFQAPSLLAPLSVVENVELPLLLGRSDPRQARVAAEGALDRLGLAAIAEKLPEEISGGQSQRVALARALAGRPRLILADEPTGQLDRGTAQQAFDALLDSLAGTPAALVVATHDPAVAARLTTIWRLHHGALEAAGP